MLDGEADKVRLRCEHPNSCLPFYVLCIGDTGDASGRPIQPTRTTQPVQQPENMLVRSGKTAILVLEGDYIRMTLPVMCLQNGGLGQQVRVISKETKKTLLWRGSSGLGL